MKFFTRTNYFAQHEWITINTANREIWWRSFEKRHVDEYSSVCFGKYIVGPDSKKKNPTSCYKSCRHADTRHGDGSHSSPSRGRVWINKKKSLEFIAFYGRLPEKRPSAPRREFTGRLFFDRFFLKAKVLGPTITIRTFASLCKLTRAHAPCRYLQGGQSNLCEALILTESLNFVVKT